MKINELGFDEVMRRAAAPDEERSQDGGSDERSAARFARCESRERCCEAHYLVEAHIAQG